MKEQHYISYGGGVNSTTFLVLEETKMDEAVFVDHGADFPYTYEYVSYLQKKGFDITVIKPEVKRRGVVYDDLYQFCYDDGLFPSIFKRWCTSNFKIRPQERYFEKPCIVSVGFDAGEIKRINRFKGSKIHGISYKFPLAKNWITREKCKEIIHDAGLKVPEKSGCFFCPFKTKKEMLAMSITHPDLYQKAIDLENNYKRAKARTLLRDGSLTSLAGWDSHKLEKWC